VAKVFRPRRTLLSLSLSLVCVSMWLLCRLFVCFFWFFSPVSCVHVSCCPCRSCRPFHLRWCYCVRELVTYMCRPAVHVT
jgi:hypothetical protein